MQERAAGSPPITAWVLLALGVIGILIGLVQAPGIIEIGSSNETASEGTPEAGAEGTPESAAGQVAQPVAQSAAAPIAAVPVG